MTGVILRNYTYTYTALGLQEAYDMTKIDKTIFSITFDFNSKRYRLVKRGDGWQHKYLMILRFPPFYLEYDEPLDIDISEMLKKIGFTLIN